MKLLGKSRGVSYRTFLELAKYYKWKSLSLWIRITDIKRFFENSTSLTLHRGSENLKIPIIRSKIKVAADLYKRERGTKTMEKELAQSDLPVWRKIKKTTRKYSFSEK